MRLHPTTIIWIVALALLGCRSKTYTGLAEREITPEDFCDFKEGEYPELCHGKYETKTHRLDTSRRAVMPQRPPGVPKGTRNDLVNGYRDGWKEQVDNHYFVVCPRHKEIHPLYTPKTKGNEEKTEDYRKGWRLGWKKAELDATIFLEKLTKKVKNKGGHNKDGDR